MKNMENDTENIYIFQKNKNTISIKGFYNCNLNAPLDTLEFVILKKNEEFTLHDILMGVVTDFTVELIEEKYHNSKNVFKCVYINDTWVINTNIPHIKKDNVIIINKLNLF